MPENKRLLGIIGGTAKIEPPNVTIAHPEYPDNDIQTPFGNASARPVIWTLPGGERAIFLNRHGEFHQFNPTAIPYRANIWLLKKLGVTDVLALSAVGSLHTDIAPGLTFVIPDQFHDLTRRTERTFFTDIAVHVGLGDPFCQGLREFCVPSVNAHASAFRMTATYVNIEGPQFSTRAESVFYKRFLNGHVIGMTTATEARLAREAGLCFATIALPADYDAWKTDERCADADMIKSTLQMFNQSITKIVESLIVDFHRKEHAPCACADSLKGMAVHTRLKEYMEKISMVEREQLRFQYGIFNIL